MDKYLRSILQEVNTIIIPGLGALTLINGETGECMFMPYLKHDDGQLAAYIAEKEGKDENDARNIIAKYVREILSSIEKGESYDMFQFGSFRKDNSGDIEFVNWDSEKSNNYSTASIETPQPNTEYEEPETVPEVEPQLTASSDEEISDEVPTSQTNTQQEIEEKIADEADEEIPYEEANEAINSIFEEPAPKVESMDPTVPQEEEKRKLTIVEKEEIEKGRNKIKALKAQKDAKPMKKRKGPVFWLMLFLVLLIVGGGTLFGINYQSWKQHIPFLANKKVTESKKDQKSQMEEILGLEKEETESQETEGESDAMEEEILDEQSEDDVQEISEPEQKSEPIRNTGTYHAIAGAFSSKENADRLVAKLKEQGYPAFVSQQGGLNMVSMKQFTTKEEALAAMSELKGITPHVWLYTGELN